MAQEKEYFAFISYQRKDEEWADRLRSKLEHYRLPSSVRKQDASLPKEIRPIFRDALELAGGVLATEIETALQQSKYLIVICSPNSAKSPWVNKEIQTFIDLGREDRIIPFIIDGTPFTDNEKTECFPPALRSLKGEKELLGININELSRDAASIKVVAHMFGLKFDTLWQRYEREKKRKRWTIIGGALLFAIFSLLIGGYFIRQNHVIEKQNSQLEHAANKLREDSIELANHIYRIKRDSMMLSMQKDSILKTSKLLYESNSNLGMANADLQRANLELLRSNWGLKTTTTKLMAERVLDYLEDGNYVEAKNIISQVCHDTEISKLMRLPEIEYTLRTFHRYLNHEGIRGRAIISHWGDDFFQFSRDCKTFYCQEENTRLVRYDVNTGKPIDTIYQVSCHKDADVTFYKYDESSNTLFFSVDSIIYAQNVLNGANKISPIITDEDDMIDVQVSPGSEFLVYELLSKEKGLTSDDEPTYHDEWYVVNMINPLQEHQLIPNCNDFYCFMPDGNNALLEIDHEYYLWNLVSNQATKLSIPISRIQKAAFSKNGDYLYAVCDSTLYMWQYPSMEHIFFLDSLKEKEPIMQIGVSPNDNIIALGLYNGDIDIINIDPLDFWNRGRIVHRLNWHKNSIHTLLFNPNGDNMLSYSSNTLRIWDVNIKSLEEKYLYRYEYISPSGNSYIGRTTDDYWALADVKTGNQIGVKIMKKERGKYWNYHVSRNSEVVVADSYNDSLIYIIQPKDGNCFTICKPNAESYSVRYAIDKNGRYLACLAKFTSKDYESLVVYDVQNQRKQAQLNEVSYYIRSMDISPDGKEICVIVGDSLNIYDTKKLMLKRVLCHGNNEYFDNLSYNSNGNLIMASSYSNTIRLFDVTSGKQIMNLSLPQSRFSLRSCSFSADDKYFMVTEGSAYDHDSKTYIWNLHTGKLVETLTGYGNCYFCKDVPNRMYYNNASYFFLDFPSIETIIEDIRK